MSLDTAIASVEAAGPVNVSQVPQLSPFRYPGGKTWLVPRVRAWLGSMPSRPRLFLEPFAGGAIVALSAAAEGLVDRAEIWELDPEVSAVWHTVFSDSDADLDWLCDQILGFEVSLDSVRAVIDSTPGSTREHAFRTVVRNRVQRGGIMAAGAGLIKSGENGRGLRSRWYPTTLVKRLRRLHELRDVVDFVEGNAFEAIREHGGDPGCALFVDPPYTAAGKRAGKRLYTHNEVDHELLFKLVASFDGPALLTYDDTAEVRALADGAGLHAGTISMKSTHHAVMRELIIVKS